MSNPIFSAIDKATEIFDKAGIETSRLDAEILLAHTLGIERSELYFSTTSLPQEKLSQFQKYCERRKLREPISYITGVKEFWSIPIKVTRDVLIPRPETELLIETVLKKFPTKNESFFILDLGGGSGCICAALAKEYPNSLLTLMDVSKRALDIASENLTFVKKRIEFIECDILGELPIKTKFDLIVSNPPYIPTKDFDSLSDDVREYEPELALLAGEDGLIYFRRLIDIAKMHLKNGGYLIFEIGFDQHESIKKLLYENSIFSDIEFSKDLAGIERSVAVRWKNS